MTMQDAGLQLEAGDCTDKQFQHTSKLSMKDHAK
jgi:hypothetical protein